MPRVVLGARPLASFVSSRRGVALALAEVAAISVLAAGVAERSVGPLAPLFLIAAVVAGWMVRAVDLETCALFVPGGAYGVSQWALGRRGARLMASALLAESIVGGTL